MRAQRGLRPVTNPMLDLPAMQAILAQEPATRRLLADLFYALGNQAQANADLSWKRHKGMMAAYWKVVAVYARHTARALRRS